MPKTVFFKIKKIKLICLMVVIILFLSVLIVTGLSLSLNGKQDKLLSVIVLFRHGARSPTQVYPNDPYKDLSYWPDGFGQLTNEGKLQLFELGKWLKKRYGSFIPERYSNKDIYVKSSDLDRTIMSAQCALTGLFPPEKDQIWLKGLNWQPIPVHIIPEPDDAVIVQSKNCTKYDKLLQEIDFLTSVNENNKKLYELLSLHTGQTIASFDDVKILYDTLFVEEHFNYLLPNWTTAYYPDKLSALHTISFIVPTNTTELARLKVGPLFHEIISQFNNASKHLENIYRKFKIYSGHDFTISNVLNTFKAFKHPPTYASCLMFELWQNSNTQHDNIYVHVVYKEENNLQTVKVPNCSEIDCPLSEFIEVLKPVTVDLDRWIVECSAN